MYLKGFSLVHIFQERSNVLLLQALELGVKVIIIVYIALVVIANYTICGLWLNRKRNFQSRSRLLQ